MVFIQVDAEYMSELCSRITTQQKIIEALLRVVEEHIKIQPRQRRTKEKAND